MNEQTKERAVKPKRTPLAVAEVPHPSCWHKLPVFQRADLYRAWLRLHGLLSDSESAKVKRRIDGGNGE